MSYCWFLCLNPQIEMALITQYVHNKLNKIVLFFK